MNEDPFKTQAVPTNKIEREKLSIKIATVEDSDAYQAIRTEAIRTNPEAYSMSPEQVKEESEQLGPSWRVDLRKSSQFIVLSEYDSKPIGMARGQDRGQGTWAVRGVFVSPEFRKRATGVPVSEDMLKKLLEEMRQRGGKLARLWVKASSANAISLYEKLGFKKVTNPLRGLSLARYNPMLLKDWYIMELDLNQEDKK
jgi:ribosomal protein S18 acetylase RimI-like enzyme